MKKRRYPSNKELHARAVRKGCLLPCVLILSIFFGILTLTIYIVRTT